MSLAAVFVSAILPVIAIAALGYAAGRVHDVDADPIATIAVHVLTPALAFHSIATTELTSGTLVRIAGALAAFVVAMILVAEAAGRLLGIEEPFLSGVVLLAAFSNAGNYGIPLSEFAFGTVGRSTALVYMTAQLVLLFTVGVYVASRSGTGDWTAGVKRIARLPLVYAVAAALAARALGLVPPADGVAMETVQLVGDAAIPVFLIILGIELTDADVGATLRTVGAATVLKMVVAPVVAIGIALVAGFGDPDVARVYVLESSTPSAVLPLVLLIEFGDPEPVDGVTVSEFASTVVLVTTLVSVPAMTLLVSLLQSGLL